MKGYKPYTGNRVDWREFFKALGALCVFIGVYYITGLAVMNWC